jgi:hypothetical protein
LLSTSSGADDATASVPGRVENLGSMIELMNRDGTTVQ